MIVMPIPSWKAAALVAAAFAFGFPAGAGAHDPGLSSLHVRIAPGRIVAALSLAAVDAGRAPGGSGVNLETFALDSVEVSIDGVRLPGVVESQVTDGQSGTNITLVFERAKGSRLTVYSAVPLRLARGHRQLLTVQGSSGEVLTERMLDAQMNAVDADLGGEQSATGTAGQFLELGVRHILGGYDHLLFLAALLMGVQRLRSIVQTVTAFTLAHSLTLAAAALGVVQVPAAVAEPVIAASIVYVGIENLVRARIDSRWKLTFAFGLVHGFGFAAALRELGIGTTGSEIVARLAWFNAGVEIGQLGVAMLWWPLIWQLNARPALRTRLAPLCSLLVIGAGSYWIVERTFLAAH
ncbi:HupE/UreJ family protein [Luteitalea pratensis]|nr:HupE/UreJ family protein [Luteitalea pratensis]